MGLFSDPSDIERREKLRIFEDKRLAFAEALDKRGFKPEHMLFSQLPNGGFSAICHFDGRQWLIVSPGLGEEGDFAIESAERFPVRREEVLVKAEGMGGMFGIGKKSERGVNYFLTRADGSEAVLSFVFGRNSWGEFSLKKNPLLNTRRRRGNANVVWDLKPIDNMDMPRIIELTRDYFGE